MIVDFHNHFYPPEYLRAVETGPSAVKMTMDGDGNPLLHYPGDYNIVVPGHRDIEYRAKSWPGKASDMQVLTLTTPGTHVESPARAVELARLVNDRLSLIMRERGSRFTALATLPLNAPEDAVAGAPAGVRRARLPRRHALQQRQSGRPERPALLAALRSGRRAGRGLLHPSRVSGRRRSHDRILADAAAGLPFRHDARRGQARLQRRHRAFPEHPWVLGHLGGAVPYLAERLDRGYAAFRECRGTSPARRASI